LLTNVFGSISEFYLAKAIAIYKVIQNNSKLILIYCFLLSVGYH
jgi:hypothetical protein